jgi:hypothetical protein
LHLLKDLVPFASSVGSEGFELLGERVAGAGLLICRDTGVEDGPEDGPLEGVVAVRVRHD